MVNKELKLHYFQKELIRKLVVNERLRFNQLLVDGLESEHMNYHLKQLIEFGLVTKQRHSYTLSDSGKDYSNLMDDEMQTVEKQPKTSVIIRGVRLNEQGEIEHLLCRRLRHPYFGKVGRLTGKVRFGETMQKAVARELYEETGLYAKNYILENVYRKLRYREDGSFIQDVIFYTFLVKDFTGTFITKTPYQENLWLTANQVFNTNNFDLYDDFEIIDTDQPRDFSFFEHCDIAQGF